MYFITASITAVIITTATATVTSAATDAATAAAIVTATAAATDAATAAATVTATAAATATVSAAATATVSVAATATVSAAATATVSAAATAIHCVITNTSPSSLDQDGRRGAIHTALASVVCSLLYVARSVGLDASIVVCCPASFLSGGPVISGPPGCLAGRVLQW